MWRKTHQVKMSKLIMNVSRWQVSATSSVRNVMVSIPKKKQQIYNTTAKHNWKNVNARPKGLLLKLIVNATESKLDGADGRTDSHPRAPDARAPNPNPLAPTLGCPKPSSKP